MTLSSYFITDSVGDNIDGVINLSPACYPFVMADLMGWSAPTVDAQGGTGYTLTPGHAYLDRVAACIAAAPDVVFVEGGYNDVVIGVSIAALQTALATLLATLRLGLPHAVIFVMGVYVPHSPTPTGAPLYNDAMRSAVQVIAGPAYFLDNLQGDGCPWITDANKAAYISADGLHPSTAGHLYLAGKAAVAAIRAQQEAAS